MPLPSSWSWLAEKAREKIYENRKLLRRIKYNYPRVIQQAHAQVNEFYDPGIDHLAIEHVRETAHATRVMLYREIRQAKRALRLVDEQFPRE